MIQMSEATAQELDIPLSLLQKRTHDVKGKGEMTTYLLDVRAALCSDLLSPPPPRR